MAGEGLEELAFGLGERADVAGAVADDQKPERALHAARRADDRIVQPTLREEPIEWMGVSAAAEQKRPLRLGAEAGTGYNVNIPLPQCEIPPPIGGQAVLEGEVIATIDTRAVERAILSVRSRARTPARPWVSRIDSYRNSRCSRCSAAPCTP